MVDCLARRRKSFVSGAEGGSTSSRGRNPGEGDGEGKNTEKGARLKTAQRLEMLQVSDPA